MANYLYITVPIVSGIVAQTLKFVFKKRNAKLDLEDLVASGGMPSTHAAFVFSLLYLVYNFEGLKSVSFGIMLAVTAVVLYDSAGVRRTTGQQTLAINKITDKVSIKKIKIHDTRGHNYTEIFAGCLVGLVIAVLLTSI